MQIPKELATYRQIEERCIYEDDASEEPGTGVTKRKYKLASYWSKHLQEIDTRLFYVSTSHPYKEKQETTIQIKADDYEKCINRNLLTKTSYYNIKDYCLISLDDIRKKTANPDNGFKNVAKIKKKSFKKFTEAAKKLKIQARPPIGAETIKTLVESVTEDEIRDDVLRDLHLI